MREPMSDTMRLVLEQAQSAARDLNQDFVGTDHLMLGLLNMESAEALSAMRTSHAEPAKVKAALLATLPRGKEPPMVSGALPLSPKAQRTLNGAIAKTQALREPCVTTRLLVIALLDEPQSPLCEALRHVGVDLETFQKKLTERPATAEA